MIMPKVKFLGYDLLAMVSNLKYSTILNSKVYVFQRVEVNSSIRRGVICSKSRYSLYEHLTVFIQEIINIR